MGKFNGILICTDCDGTLTDSNGELSDENAAAIKYFQENGGKFTLATGRFPEHVLKFSDKLKVNAPIISLNGVLLYDLEANNTIHDLSMNKGECIEVLKYLNENHKGIWEYWLNYNGKVSKCYKPAEDRYETGEDFKGMTKIMPEKVSKVVFVMPEDMLRTTQKALREKFGDKFNFDSSWPNGLEMQWIKSSKGIAVEKLKKHLGNIKTTICIGDYDNDISMLRAADISYAVGNAIDEVKEAADKITVTNNENAIAKIINELEFFV